MTLSIDQHLADHAERVKWNAKHSEGYSRSFRSQPILDEALAAGVPNGPVLELACGTSGNALALAAAGRSVTALDVSDVALALLDEEARRSGLADRITLRHTDLSAWRPGETRYALVLCVRYWERALFPVACEAVAPGGLLAWEAFSLDELRYRPAFHRAWCVGADEPASLLPPGHTLLSQRAIDDGKGATHRMLARRDAGAA
jgi:hypothetical protein